MYIIFVITYEGFQTIEIEQIVLGFQKISCSSYYAAKFCMARKEMCHLQHRALFRIDLRVAFWASTLTFTCLTSLYNSFPCIPPQWKNFVFLGVCEKWNRLGFTVFVHWTHWDLDNFQIIVMCSHFNRSSALDPTLIRVKCGIRHLGGSIQSHLTNQTWDSSTLVPSKFCW